MNCANTKCGIEFIPHRYNQKFCSSKCQNSQSIKRYRKQVYKECKSCGASTKRSDLCRSCASSKNRNDWDNISIKEVTDKRKYQIYSQVRELARHVYKNSNQEYKCYNCGYDRHVEICHIKAIASFGEDTKISVINHINNLVALCPNCHWELDNGLLTLPL